MKQIKKIIPDKPQLALYLVLSLILIVLLDIKEYLSYYKLQIVGASSDSDLFSGFNIVPTSLSQSRVGEAVFWGGLGAIIYLVIWIFNSVITNVRNDLTADQYVHPANFNRAKFWETIIAYKLWLLGTIIITLLYIFNAVKLGHIAGRQFYKAVFNSTNIQHSLLVVAADLLLAVLAVHIIFLLMKVLAYFTRVVYKGL